MVKIIHIEQQLQDGHDSEYGKVSAR